jgi:hypothetical protein
MIFKSGKYDAVSHRRIVELPTKTMPPLWGGRHLVCGLEGRDVLLPSIRRLRGDGRG